MWSYYGSKAKIIDHYPKPVYDKIIEPFAGSARYALKYFEHDVLLVDKYATVVNMWNWLKLCTGKDILGLPIPGSGQTTDDLNYDCIEAKHLVGFIINYAQASPMKRVSPHFRNNRKGGVKYSLNRIAADLYKIRHWQIIGAGYEKITNQPATWFIDPPYQIGGHKYVHSNKKIDFDHLAGWCQEREGQVIVCETMKADWLPFNPLIRQTTANGSNIEAIYTNYHTHFNNVQQQLF